MQRLMVTTQTIGWKEKARGSLLDSGALLTGIVRDVGQMKHPAPLSICNGDQIWVKKKAECMATARNVDP